MKQLFKKSGSVLLAVLFFLISMVALTTLTHMQGNARIVNYTGIVRGATQRLVKQELKGQPNDDMIHFLDGIVAELATGEGDNNLIVLPDPRFQNLVQQMQLSWTDLKTEIAQVRQGKDTGRLYQLSEDYFLLADQTVSAAEMYSEKRVSISIGVLLSLNIGFIGLFVLLWVSRKRQKRVRRALDLAESANRAKSEFLSRMSHEIRTPMNGITGMTAVARRSMNNPERVLDCLNKIDLSAGYLLALINDVLDMSRIESGKIELEYKEFDLTEVFDRIYWMFRQKAEAGGVELQVLRDDLTVTLVTGDSLRLSQVLINLVSNALKFTPAGGLVTLHVRETEVSETFVSLEFTVTDTGIGISEDFQSRLFEPFEQERPATAQQYGGTGLGLAISNNFVSMMGGRIFVRSTPGEGSCFTVALSFKRPSPEAAARFAKTCKTTTDAAERDTYDFAGIRVLLAEDNEINAEIVTCLLEDSGASVDHANDGLGAVRKLRESAPGTYALILMDIQMPVMNGIEACRAIRASSHPDGRTIPIIGLSANAFREDIENATRNGMNGYLSKPINLESLFRAMDEVIQPHGH